MSQKIFELIEKEKVRQVEELELIPSENYVSENVLKALGSVLTNKYSEGFPGARYYAGNVIIDQIENYTRDLANELFGTKHAIVQPYSGSPANLAVYLGLLNPGDTALGLALPMGGHLTHGASVSATGKLFNVIQYGVDGEGKIDFAEVEKLVEEHKPKLIWTGGTAYAYLWDFAKFREIADKVGAILVADISHFAGLIIGGVHPSPVEYVDVITTTTHKTLRGPRGAMILVTERGVAKDPELGQKLEKAVFPGLQGGPHNHQTAAIAVALEEANTPEFKEYASQVVKNAKVLADSLKEKGIDVIGTENHLMLIDLRKLGYGLGYQTQIALEIAGLTVNKNTIPGEPVSAFYPSGVRIGTPALTTRGMKEDEMEKVASWIARVLEEIKGHDLPEVQEERREFIKEFKKWAQSNPKLLKVKEEVKEFAKEFPVPGVS